MNIIEMKLADIIPYENNPRRNEDAVQYVANSIKEFGFKVPIVIDKENVIVAGHTRALAAERLGMDTVPVIKADDLNEEQVRAFRLADNKTAEMASWDFAALDLELADITDIDMSDFGFGTDEEEKAFGEDIKEVSYIEKISVVIDCKDDEEAETIFEKLTEEGYTCHISTL